MGAQPASLLSTVNLDLVGSTLLLGLGRFGAKLFNFHVDLAQYEEVCMFEEMLDRTVAMTEPPRAHMEPSNSSQLVSMSGAIEQAPGSAQRESPPHIRAQQLRGHAWGTTRMLLKEYRVHFRFIDLGLMLPRGSCSTHLVTATSCLAG